ncbi:MAG: tetratricopeptide repeat protein [Aulosira sp. DedQUE10]|nr:tetratricopeptide repeat protein [Aulosira sp. DedQUE10]
MTIFKKYNAKAGEANSLTNIGYVYLRKGEYSKALDFLQQSLAIRKQARDPHNEWIPLSYIGEYISIWVNIPKHWMLINQP